MNFRIGANRPGAKRLGGRNDQGRNDLGRNAAGAKRLGGELDLGRNDPVSTEIAEVSQRQPLDVWKTGPEVLTNGKLRRENADAESGIDSRLH